MKKFEVYFCPICGKTKTEEISDDVKTEPLLHCGPHEDEERGTFMVMMAQIFPRGEDDPAGKLNMSEITTSHKERHIFLHKMLDELLADFIDHTECLPSKTTLLEFMQWSAEQIENPTEKET